MVSLYSLLAMVFTILICFMVPIGCLWWIRRRYQASLKSFLVGMITFVVATQIFEALVHLYLLKINETTASFLMQPLIYALYGGLMAGIFEESARFISFKWFLKRENRVQDSISYGIGHGGIEAMLIVGTTYLNNLAISLLINQGLIEQLGLSTEVEESLVTQLTQISPLIFSLAGYERFMTLFIQIGLSVLVFKGVRERKIRYYLWAIILHAVLDMPAALAQLGYFNFYAVEGFITVVAILSIVFVYRQLKVYHEDLTKAEDPELKKLQQEGY